jgi:hypothetical protein
MGLNMIAKFNWVKYINIQPYPLSNCVCMTGFWIIFIKYPKSQKIGEPYNLTWEQENQKV